MKAVIISKIGGPEVLELKNIKLEDPRSDEVLIKNEAIGLNYIDTYHRSGLYPVELPSNIGIEGAGVIEKIGPNVKNFKVGDEIDCVITEIDKEKKRVAISHRLTIENPFETFEKKYPVDTIVEGEVVSKNEYSIFLKVDDLDIDAFLHCNDLTYLTNGEEELAKYQKGDKLKVKVLEIKATEQKVRVGLRQTQKDPFDWFKDKKNNETITVKIISSDNKGLTVKPEGCEMDFIIKKSAIAINAADARPTRFTGGERIDCAIAKLDFDKKKVVLSIKLLEEIQNKDAISKFSSPLSGKNLPFSSLSDELEKKDKKKEDK